MDALNGDEKINLVTNDGSLKIKQAGGKKNTFKNTFKKSVSQNKNTFKKSVSQKNNKYTRLKRKKNYYKKKYLMTKKLLNKYVKKQK